MAFLVALRLDVCLLIVRHFPEQMTQCFKSLRAANYLSALRSNSSFKKHIFTMIMVVIKCWKIWNNTKLEPCKKYFMTGPPDGGMWLFFETWLGDNARQKKQLLSENTPFGSPWVHFEWTQVLEKPRTDFVNSLSASIVQDAGVPRFK